MPRPGPRGLAVSLSGGANLRLDQEDCHLPCDYEQVTEVAGTLIIAAALTKQWL